MYNPLQILAPQTRNTIASLPQESHSSIFVMFNKYPKGFPAGKANQKVYRIVQLCT